MGHSTGGESLNSKNFHSLPDRGPARLSLGFFFFPGATLIGRMSLVKALFWIWEETGPGRINPQP